MGIAIECDTRQPGLDAREQEDIDAFAESFRAGGEDDEAATSRREVSGRSAVGRRRVGWLPFRRPSISVKALDVTEYKYGFFSQFEMDKAPKGLSEEIVRFISAKKGEPDWMTEWRLEAYRRWLTMEEPTWARVGYPKIDFQEITYYAAPKSVTGPMSLEDVDPELLNLLQEARHSASRAGDPRRGRGRQGAPRCRRRRVRLGLGGHHLQEGARQGRRDLLPDLGGGAFASRAGEEVPRFSVVPTSDNYYATLNAAVFSDGSFVYIPPGVRCPMELSTYFRINEENTGQFERTLIIADEGAYVSYLEGCTAPKRDDNQLHAAVVELVTHDEAEIKYSTVQNWYPGDSRGQGRHLQLRDQARRLPRQELEDFVDPGRDRLRDHLEVSRPASCAVTAHVASSTRSRSPTAASRSIPAPR